MRSNIAPKPLKIYIDENIAPQMANAFNIMQSHLNKEEKKSIEVYSIADVCGEGVDDEEWIPIIAKDNSIVITQDRRIQHSRHQRELYQSEGIGVIFLKSQKNGMSFWEMFKHLVKWWDDIKAICRKNKPPFAFRQPGSTQKFVFWDD